MKIKIVIFLGLALFLRLFLLDVSTHFLSDESRDLVNIHQIWVEKKVTLVGPISDDRSHVYSSLTYYMLLPFAIGWNFDPLGTVVGAAFWGILTWFLMIKMIQKYHPNWWLLGMGLATIWWPLISTSRWPWNPNLLLFWLFLGLFLNGSKNQIVRIATGLVFGLAIHHHYLAIIPAALMIIKQRDWLLALGIAIALCPFIIFDLRHPPGIFISRMIDYNQGAVKLDLGNQIFKFKEIFAYLMEQIFQQKAIILIGTMITLGLSVWDVFKNSSARGWLIMWLLTLVPLIFYSKQSHYLLPILPFFVLWLFSKREFVGEKLAKSMVILIIIGSVFNIASHYQQPDWMGDLRVLRGGTKIIKEQIESQKLVNANLAVLASPDIYPSGKKFRDLLLVNNIRLKMYEEYETSDNLFIITMADEPTLRKDPAAELAYFKNGPFAGLWQIPGTKWKVIQLNRY